MRQYTDCAIAAQNEKRLNSAVLHTKVEFYEQLNAGQETLT